MDDEFSASELLAEIKRLVKENTKLRTALSFYANPDHWKAIITGGGYGPVPVVDDSGKIARCALDQ